MEEQATVQVPGQMQSPPLVEPRRTLADLLPLITALALFALFGGTARALVRWNAVEPWQRRVGGIMASILAALLIGLPLSEYPIFRDRIGLLLGLGAAASWGGIEFIDMITRRLERYAQRRWPLP